MTRAFVTGGSGFVGRTLIPFLRGHGVSVRALARSATSATQVEMLGAEPVRGDLDDLRAMTEGMAGCDYVFHAAAKVSDYGPRAEFQRDTIEGTANVLAACAAARIGRLVHVSTEAVLVGGGPIVRADETRPLPAKPLGLYPWSKGRAEELVRQSPVDGVIVRPRFIWGKGDTVLLPRLVQAVKAGRFAWIGGGRYLTSTVHVKNVAFGMWCAAQRGKKGETYFLTDGDPVEFRAFISEMLATQGVTIPDRSVPYNVARAIAFAGESAFKLLAPRKEPPLTRTGVRLIGEEVTVVDAKARREIGYSSLVSVKEGLEELRAS